MTARRVGLHVAGSGEYLAALQWHLDRSVSVAVRFQSELTETLPRISDFPEHSAVDEAGIRWRRLHRFPHLVYYRELEDGTIQVLAIAHERREPGYWRGRIE